MRSSGITLGPEVLLNDGIPQTSKLDVWSLFVTLVYAMDVNGYRRKAFRTKEQMIIAVLEAAATTVLLPLNEMAMIDPIRRASADDMQQKTFRWERAHHTP